MSVICVGGRRYVTNLRWLERRGLRATARTSRRLRRHWFVHRGGRTGFAARDASGIPDGLPALSLALQALIDGESWMALVEGDADGGGVRYAQVTAPGGAVPAVADEVFDDRPAALEAFERARTPSLTLHATPGLENALVGPGSEIGLLDPEALGEAASRAGWAIVLVRPWPGRPLDWRRVAVAAGLAVQLAVLVAAVLVDLIAGGSLWEGRDAPLESIAGSVETAKPLLPPLRLGE